MSGPVTERLSSADTAALYADAGAAPLHVGGVVIVDPGEQRKQWYDDVVTLVEQRLALVPRFRQKVFQVPGRLAPPVWADDPHFDIAFHIRRCALAPPGGPEQLRNLIGQLISRPLDHQRPLWELYLIHGLADGQLALVNKTHQAMVDRLGAVSLAEALLDRAGPGTPNPVAAWSPRPAPSAVHLLAGALGDIVSRPATVIGAVRSALGDVGTAAIRLGAATVTAATSALSLVSGAVRVLGAGEGPGRAVTSLESTRIFRTAQLNLAQLRTISAAQGCSVNDVIIAVLSGAIRVHLLAAGAELTPTRRVRALIPISTRSTPGQTVETMLIDLPVTEPNPVLRLDAISFATSRFAASRRVVGADALIELGQFGPPTIHMLAAQVASTLSRRSYDVLISNVPGSQGPLAVAGAPVHAIYPIAPLAAGQLLAIACTSNAGQVYVGLTLDRRLCGTADILGQAITESLTELADATLTRSRRAGQTKGEV